MVFFSLGITVQNLCVQGTGKGLRVSRKMMILGLVLGIPPVTKLLILRELSPGRKTTPLQLMCYVLLLGANVPAMSGVKTWWRGGSQIDETLNCQFNLYDPSRHLRCIFGKKKSKWNQIKLLHQMLKIEHDVKGQAWHAISKTQNEGNFIL